MILTGSKCQALDPSFHLLLFIIKNYHYYFDGLIEWRRRWKKQTKQFSEPSKWIEFLSSVYSGMAGKYKIVVFVENADAKEEANVEVFLLFWWQFSLWRTL